VKNFFISVFFFLSGGVLVSDYIPGFLFYLIPFLIIFPLVWKNFWTVLLFFMGIFLLGGFLIYEEKLPDRKIERCFVSCHVDSIPYVSPDFTAFSCRVSSSDIGFLEGRKINVYLKGENRDVFIGSLVSFFGRGYVQENSIKLFVYEGFMSIDNDKNPFYYIARLKNFLINRYFRYSSGDSSFALGMALIFGERGYLTKEKKDFINAGTSHLLAISGMHVGILIIIMLFVTAFLGRFSYYITAVFLLVYPFFTGLHIPVVRASALGVLYLYSKIKYLKVNPFDLLFFVAVVIVLFSPSALFSVSFQLSFIAVLGLLLFRDLLELKTGRKAFDLLISSLLMSVVAVIFTVPVVVYYFGKFSLATVVATPVLVFLLFPYLFLSVFNLFTFFSIEPAVYLMDFIGKVFLDINGFFADLEAVYSGYNPSPVMVIVAITILVIVALFRFKHLYRLAVSILVLLIFLSFSKVRSTDTLVYVKKGSKIPAVAVITPYGDCFYSSRKVYSLLDKYGCTLKIPFYYHRYYETTFDFDYKRGKEGYLIILNGAVFRVENRDYTFYPLK